MWHRRHGSANHQSVMAIRKEFKSSMLLYTEDYNMVYAMILTHCE